jgi:hypothetical protein
MTLKKRDSCCHFNMVILSLKVAGIVLLTCLKVTCAQDQLIYSVKTNAGFSWLADDDSQMMTTSQIYQMENAAATYFGELLGEALKKKEEQDTDPLQAPLQTKVAVKDQIVGLTATGERLTFEIPSIVDFTYIGTEEIASITNTLQESVDASRDSAAFSNLNTLAGGQPQDSFKITFSNTTMKASTLLFTVEDTSVTESNNGLVGLIIACTIASISLFVASLILLWAVGRFDGWTLCKDLRARFYMPSPKDPPSPIPYGMTAKTTDDDTEAGNTIGATAMHLDKNHELQDQGIEMTPSRGIFRVDEDESEILSPVDSEFTEASDFSHVSSIAPLGIASFRKETRKGKVATGTSPACSGISTRTMSPESILADIESMTIDMVD